MKKIKKIKHRVTPHHVSPHRVASHHVSPKNKKRKFKNLNKFKKLLFKPLKFSRLTLLILGIIFGIFILFLILNFIFLIYLNTQFKKDLATLEHKTDKKIAAVISAANQAPATTTKTTGESLNSFGDHFSGLAFIAERQTNMNWDTNVTAFTFPPLYSFEKVQRGLDGVNLAPTENSKIAPRLKVSNNELYYRGRKLELPPELSEENILNITVSLNGSRWLVGIVTGKNYDERGWVYFYDPAKQIFSPLITAATALKIEPKFERTGGVISFGGEADDFLIVYSGYDGRAFYYYKGTLTNVSQFFGLRVSGGGFSPQIISQANSRGTVFYICSKTEGKPKLIKFWPKSKGELMGSIDFSPLIFTGNLGSASARCEIENKSKSGGIQILIDFKNSETWRFVDQGFNNSQDREVVSSDIGQNRGKKITKARVSLVDLASDNSGSNSTIFLANTEPFNWEQINYLDWFEFKEPATSLFWRATFKAEPNDPDYSPWFDRIGQLDYQTN